MRNRMRIMDVDAESTIPESSDDVMVRLLRTKTPAEKIEMLSAAHRTARLLAAAGI